MFNNFIISLLIDGLLICLKDAWLGLNKKGTEEYLSAPVLPFVAVLLALAEVETQPTWLGQVLNP